MYTTHLTVVVFYLLFERHVFISAQTFFFKKLLNGLRLQLTG